MMKKRLSFHDDRSWTDVAKSTAFWVGFTAGFAPGWPSSAPTLQKIKRYRLEKCDPVAYAWVVAGSFLTGALTEVYGQETQLKSGAQAAGESTPGNAVGCEAADSGGEHEHTYDDARSTY